MGRRVAATLGLAMVLVGLLAGCALFGRSDSGEADLKVLTRPVTGDERRALGGRDPDHPHQFTRGELLNLLQSLHFSRYESVPINTPVIRIFADPDINRIAPRLQEAFARSRRSDAVVVEMRRPAGKTSGAFFVVGNTLVAKFEQINGMDHLRPPIALDPTRPAPQWTLIPRDGQDYFQARGLLGLSAKDPSAITVSLARLALPPAAPTTEAPAPSASATLSAPATAPPTLAPPAASPAPVGREAGMTAEQYRARQPLARERLQFLKELKDSGLISDEEYKRKQKEILDQL